MQVPGVWAERKVRTGIKGLLASAFWTILMIYFSLKKGFQREVFPFPLLKTHAAAAILGQSRGHFCNCRLVMDGLTQFCQTLKLTQESLTSRRISLFALLSKLRREIHYYYFFGKRVFQRLHCGSCPCMHTHTHTIHTTASFLCA